MIDYGEKPSNQSKFTLEGDTDAETVLNVREWSIDNPKGWKNYLSIVQGLNERGIDASPNFCLAILREIYHISVSNSCAPIFARLAKEQRPELRFRMAKSRYDGFFEVAL